MLKRSIIALGTLFLLMIVNIPEVAATENGNVNEVERIGSNSLDVLTKVLKAPDGGYIAIGAIGYDEEVEDQYSQLYVPFPRSVVIKFSKDMDVEWTNYYNDSIHYIDDIMLDNDDNYIIVGHYDNNRVILKLDSEGDIIWKQEGPKASLSKHSVARTDDGGFIIAGNLYEHDDIYSFVKYDESGHVEWKKGLSYSKYDVDQIYNLIQVKDGFAINATAWKCKKSGDVMQQCDRVNLVMKYDRNANVKWVKELDQEITDLIVNKNGQIVVVGHQTMINKQRSGLFFIVTESRYATYATIMQLNSKNGDVMWNEKFGGDPSRYFYFTSVTKDDEGNLIASGYTHNYSLPTVSNSTFSLDPFGERDYYNYLGHKTNNWLTLFDSIVTDDIDREWVDVNAIMVKYNDSGEIEWETMNEGDASLSVLYDDDALITVGFDSVDRRLTTWGAWWAAFDGYYSKTREDDLSLSKIDHYDHKSIERHNTWVIVRCVLLYSGIALTVTFIVMKRIGRTVLFISSKKSNLLLKWIEEQGIIITNDSKGNHNVIMNRHVIAIIKIHKSFTYINRSTKDGRTLIKEGLRDIE